MKRSFLAVITAAVLSLSLVGCAGGTQPSNTPTGPVTLVFWSGFTGGDADTYKQAIAEFNSTHPNIQIDYQLQPWDTIAQKLPAAIASGSGPDIATPDYNVATVLQYAGNGLALPITNVVGDGDGQVPASVIPKAILNGFTVDGKLYAVPASFTTLMLYYNKKLLSAAGLTPPTTMKELQDDAVKLTANGVYGISLADNNTIGMWPTLIWSDGGDIVNAQGCSALSDQTTIDSVQAWASLIVNSKISPVGQSGQDADNLFAASKAAFEINGPNAAGEYTPAGIDFGVVAVPTGASGTPVTLASTVPMIISAQSKHPAEAQEFLAWWMGKDAQRIISVGAAGGPARSDMADDPALQANPLVQSFSAQVPYSRLLLPDQKDFAQINQDIFQPAIQAATRDGDAATHLKDASAQLNTLLGC